MPVTPGRRRHPAFPAIGWLNHDLERFEALVRHNQATVEDAFWNLLTQQVSFSQNRVSQVGAQEAVVSACWPRHPKTRVVAWTRLLSPLIDKNNAIFRGGLRVGCTGGEGSVPSRIGGSEWVVSGHSSNS